MRAPAKINLHLGVGAPRDDGFHPLDTVFQAVGLFDDVRADRGDGTVRSSPRRTSSTVAVATLADPSDNIVVRAARLLGSGRRP